MDQRDSMGVRVKTKLLFSEMATVFILLQVLLFDESADGSNFGCSPTYFHTPGSTHCACPTGYRLKGDQKTCIDVDECSLGNGGCSGLCVNYKGGFHCSCPEGHYLHPDAKTCIPLSCPRVPVPLHSTLRCRDGEKAVYRPGEMPADKNFKVGATCRVKCDRGFGGRRPAIVCRKDGKWSHSLPECRALRCPPLPPPSSGDVHPPSCQDGSAAVKQKCVFSCPPGYRISGQEVITCRNNLTWSRKKPTRCVPETEVSISCSDDAIVVELLPDEGRAEIQLTSPRYTGGTLTVRPDWVSVERASIFSVGETEVTFSVSDPRNKTAECSLSVIVLDRHPPVFPDCPDHMVLESGSVKWDEPVPEDNVGVASLAKSLEPGSILGFGLHFVEYVARDFAGNVGHCSFHINVTGGGICEDLADPENGEANCREWMSGSICQPICFENFTRIPELYACDETGSWTPSNFTSPCWPECLTDETWSPQIKRCVKKSLLP